MASVTNHIHGSSLTRILIGWTGSPVRARHLSRHVTAATANQNPPRMISRVLIGPQRGDIADIVCFLAATHLMPSLCLFLRLTGHSRSKEVVMGVQFQALFLIWLNYLFGSGGSYYFLICSPSRLAVGKTINEREKLKENV